MQFFSDAMLKYPVGPYLDLYDHFVYKHYLTLKI